MGHMRRAEERERLLREKLGPTHSVVLQWRRSGDVLLLNVLGVPHRDPLTRERTIRNPQTIVDLVNKSLSPLQHGPRAIVFHQALAAGRGEIQIEITAEQFKRLRGHNT